MHCLEWIDPKIRKPEGELFWALTQGRPESLGRDWAIIRLINDEYGDYRTLDYSVSFHLPNTCKGQCQFDTIFAWLPIEAIPINDKDF